MLKYIFTLATLLDSNPNQVEIKAPTCLAGRQAFIDRSIGKMKNELISSFYKYYYLLINDHF